jgi:hypothetical protein
LDDFVEEFVLEVFLKPRTTEMSTTVTWLVEVAGATEGEI